jgi:hypothetical protein
MVAFEVVVNGKKACNAGLAGRGVLTAILSWAHRVPHLDPETNQSYPTEELMLDVGGLVSTSENQPGDQMSWLRRQLQVGDTITINIKNLETVDEPETRERQKSEDVARQAKRRYFEQLKKEFDE